jgi:hypothetical protein
MRIEILDEAQQDLTDGFRFYENQRAGLGDYFLDSLFSDVDSLHLYAGIHVLAFGYHRLLSKRFPFAIYYRVKSKTIFVHAKAGYARNPSFLMLSSIVW